MYQASIKFFKIPVGGNPTFPDQKEEKKPNNNYNKAIEFSYESHRIL